MFPLVIMAAGMSSRYQKSKQLEYLIEEYNLIDFSIYDALKIGFKEIILIIQEEQKIAFTQKISNFDKKTTFKFMYSKIRKYSLKYFSCHLKAKKAK